MSVNNVHGGWWEWKGDILFRDVGHITRLECHIIRCYIFRQFLPLQLNHFNIRLHRLISTACRGWRVTPVFTLWRWCWCWTAVSIEAGRIRSLLSVDHVSSLQCVLAVLLSWSAAVSWLTIVFVCHQCRWLHRSRRFSSGNYPFCPCVIFLSISLSSPTWYLLCA